jgi:hypothetical protein
MAKTAGGEMSIEGPAEIWSEIEVNGTIGIETATVIEEEAIETTDGDQGQEVQVLGGHITFLNVTNPLQEGRARRRRKASEYREIRCILSSISC